MSCPFFTHLIFIHVIHPEQVHSLPRSVASDDPPMASESVTEVKEKHKRNNAPSKEHVRLSALETILVRGGRDGLVYENFLKRHFFRFSFLDLYEKLIF